MNIYVLVKRTFDTEEKIVVSGGKIQEDGAEFIINPYDEYAIEEAIQKRLNFVEIEKENSKYYDYIVINDEVERAVEEIDKIIG